MSIVLYKNPDADLQILYDFTNKTFIVTTNGKQKSIFIEDVIKQVLKEAQITDVKIKIIDTKQIYKKFLENSYSICVENKILPLSLKGIEIYVEKFIEKNKIAKEKKEEIMLSLLNYLEKTFYSKKAIPTLETIKLFLKEIKEEYKNG